MVAGVVVGIAATVAVAATSTGGGTRRASSSGAANAYIADWRRSQLGTWKVVLRWQRTAHGSHLDDQIRIAQRPPDRLSVALGSVEARSGGRSLACAAGEDGRLRCRDAGSAPPYDQEVNVGEAVLRQQLVGHKRLYDVTATSHHCYDFRLRVNYPAPHFGRQDRFCFDEDTGAPTLRDIDRAEARDVQEAVSVSGQVTDADLAPPPGKGQ